MLVWSCDVWTLIARKSRVAESVGMKVFLNTFFSTHGVLEPGSKKKKTMRKTKEDGRVMPAVRSGKRFFFLLIIIFSFACVCRYSIPLPVLACCRYQRKGAKGKRRNKIAAYAVGPNRWIGMKRNAVYPYR